MQQAILITAYKNYNHLEAIVDFFNDDFNIYIHIDRKSNISDDKFHYLNSLKGVKLMSRKYKVNWGGINHLRAILLLAQHAILDSENKYFHLISGHDFPIKTIDQFREFFKYNAEKNFIDNFDFPKPGWSDNDGVDRIEYYNFFDVYDWKIATERLKLQKILTIQKKLGYRRRISNRIPKLYGGSTWWSLNRKTLEYVLEYTKKNDYFLKRFKYTVCSEEFYFQTIIMNSKFATNVTNDNLRYIDWTLRNGNNPAILDASDFKVIYESNKFFARKFEYPTSQALLSNLIKEIEDV